MSSARRVGVSPYQLVVSRILLCRAPLDLLRNTLDEILVLDDRDHLLNAVRRLLKRFGLDRVLESRRLAGANDKVVRDATDQVLDRRSLLMLAAKDGEKVRSPQPTVEDGEILWRLRAEDVQRTLHDVVVRAGWRGRAVSARLGKAPSRDDLDIRLSASKRRG